MFSRSVSIFALAALLIVSTNARAADFEIDKAHSKIGFSVAHMMISEVTGYFKDFDGTFSFDPEKGVAGKPEFTAKAASVDTGNAKRDDHLRSPDFFDVAKFPLMTLKTDKVTKTSAGHYAWDTELTIHGVKKPVKFELVHKGTIKDPFGLNRAAFTATATISRKDFGLTWNKAMEAGGVVVGDDVKITIDVEATEKTAKSDKK